MSIALFSSALGHFGLFVAVRPRYSQRMNTNEIVAALDSEISRLRQVRDLLTGQGSASSSRLDGSSSSSSLPKRRGRPPGSKNKTASVAVEQGVSLRKGMSAEAKERISEAQRKRWAKHKAAAKKMARTL